MFEDYHPIDGSNPEIIAKEAKINFSYNNYGTGFDGMLQNKDGKFHIFINLDRTRYPGSHKSRFTFAHELGHFFIEEHHWALKNGLAPSHPSVTDHPNPHFFVEAEADYFAGALLMPQGAFNSFCKNEHFNPTLIKNISIAFEVSLNAALLRYFEFDFRPLAIVCSKKGKICWYKISDDFPYQYPKPSKFPVPPNTVAGEYFRKKVKRTLPEIVYAKDWFNDFKMNPNHRFWESCYYYDYYDFVLSVIWED